MAGTSGHAHPSDRGYEQPTKSAIQVINFDTSTKQEMRLERIESDIMYTEARKGNKNGTENDSILKYTKFILTLAAAVPMDFRNKYFAYMYKTSFWIFVVGNLTMGTTHVTGMIIFIVNHDWDLFLEGVSFASGFVNAAYKTTLLRKDLLSTLFKKVDEFERIVAEDEGSNSIYKKYVKLSSLVTALCATSLVGTLIFLAALSLSTTVEKPDGTQGRKLMTVKWYFLDVDKHFTISLITETFILYCTFLHFLGIDVFLYSLFLACAAQFRVLQHRIRNMTSYRLKLSKERNISIEAAEVLVARKVAMLHLRATDMTKEVDTRFKAYIFLEFLLSSFRISFGLIKLIYRTDTLVDYLASILYITTHFSEIFFYYWNANAISVESSEGIYTAVATSDYDDLSPASRRTLTLILTRATVESAISIGNMNKMSLDIFIKLMKASYYYISILNYFHSDKRN